MLLSNFIKNKIDFDNLSDFDKNGLKFLLCIKKSCSLEIENYYLSKENINQYLHKIDSYIQLIKKEDVYLPRFNWEKRKLVQKEINRSNAVLTNFTEGINSKVLDGTASSVKLHAYNKLKNNPSDFLSGKNLDLEVMWEFIKKDETKQSSNIEKIIEYCHYLLNLKGKLDNLPSGKEKAWYLINQEVKNGFSKKPKDGTESLDLLLRLNEHKYFIMHKYQAGSGGGQSQIFKKVVNNISKGCLEKDTSVIYIAEGCQSHTVHNYNNVFKSFEDFYTYVYNK